MAFSASPPLRLLVRMPTRGRPQQALQALRAYRSLAGMPVTLEVVIDADDESMAAPDVRHGLHTLGCVVTVGRHKSKVDAVNSGRVTEWDALLLASDDMMPVAANYAVTAVDALRNDFPHLDGAVYFNDGHQGARCCTLPIMGRRWYDRFGYVYHRAYKSLFCDQEQTELWSAMGRLVYHDEVLIEHRHHIWGLAEKDALYARNDALWGADETVFNARRASRRPHSQYGFDTPPLWLSICIASLPARRARLDAMVDELFYQARTCCPGEVEVLVDDRAPPVSIGEKRQALLERARGHFIVYVDDDDAVAHDYVERITDALRNNPDVDCLAMRGWLSATNGLPAKRWEISRSHERWSEEPSAYLRSTNHLAPVRREIALRVGFSSVSHGEDSEYARWLRPLLSTEATTGDAPIYYYLFDATKASA